MTAHGAEDIAKHVKVYIRVFLALMVLTVATVAIASLKHSVAVGVALAMFIASIKGSLVACYFMHLISERKVVYVVLAFTIFFFAALMLLPNLAVQDIPQVPSI